MSFTSGGSRWSDVYLAAGSRAVSVCGDFLAATTLALVLQQQGHGGYAVSGLLLAASLPLALLAPISGRLADRADSRTVLVVAGLAQAATCVALAFASHPALIIALVALLACGLAVTGPTLQALLPRMVWPEDLPRAGGLVQTAGVLGMLVAPALAGLLLPLTGARLPLLLDAASYLALVVAGMLLRTRRRGGSGAGSGPAAVAWRLRDDRALAVLIGALAAGVAGVSAVNVVDVFYIRDTLGASTTAYGLVTACWSLGMLVGGLLFGRLSRERITAPRLILLMAGACVPITAAAAVPTVWWMGPLWVLGGLCNGGINVFAAVIVASRVPSAAHGRAYAAMGASVQGAGLLGLLVAGPLVEQFAPRPLVAAGGAAGLVIALACLPLVRRETSRPPAGGSGADLRDTVAA